MDSFKGGAKCFVDSGPACCTDVFDEVDCPLTILVACGLESIEQRFGLGGKPNDFKAVIIVEAFNAEFYSLGSLVNLVTAHGTGSVEDEKYVFGEWLYVFFPCLWAQ